MTDRPRTPTDVAADEYVEQLAVLDPLLATSVGLPGHDDEMPDLSPDGHEARAQAARAMLARLDGLTPVDDVDRVTHAAMRERLGVELELHTAGEDLRLLNNLASPVQGLRDVFDLMPTDTAADWAPIAIRAGRLPDAMRGYLASLRAAAAAGHLAPIRQVRAAVEQAEELAGPESFFVTFAAGAHPDGREPSAALRADLDRAVTAARAAYAELAAMLTDELAPRAPTDDACGRERYELWSREFLGGVVDLDETYEWGLAELDRIIGEQEQVAAELYGPGVSPSEAMARLDADPARRIVGTEALREWMQATADEAIAALADVVFDIPAPVRRLEARIAPTHTGGIYYTGPSADFSRPGRMWWSVPEGVTEFGTWREKTTVYHEGVPGHHLQVAQTAYRSDLLNVWRRLVCWVSGHGEGWALYAERLMADLGYLDDPADRLGMLDSQRLRAARVVLDIGVHLRKPFPARWAGLLDGGRPGGARLDVGRPGAGGRPGGRAGPASSGVWDAAKAWPFLTANANMAEGFLAFELDRYLGWPAQATSYAVGRRLWEQIRDAARRADAGPEPAGGDAWLRSFHRRALDVGSVGLDVLRQVLAPAP